MNSNTRQENFKIAYRCMAAGLITFVVSLLYAFIWYGKLNPLMDREFLLKGNWLMIAIYVVLVVVFFVPFRAYKVGSSRKAHALLSQGLGLIMVNGVEVVFTVMMIGRAKHIPAIIRAFVQLYGMQLVVILFVTVTLINVYRKLFPAYHMLQIYGSHENDLANKMNARDDKFHVTGGISADEPMSKIKKAIDMYDAVLVNDVPSPVRNPILKYCFEQKKRVYFTPKISDIFVVGSDEMDLFDSPLYLNKNTDISIFYRILKRLLDISVALVGITLSSPFMIAAAIAIHAYDKGPVFYKQRRLTKDGKEFDIYKFRSMIVDAEKNTGARLAAENDDRITPVGHFIRKTRIDELPQFFNILSGNMSVVGPRPERPEIHKDYCKKVPEFDYRLRVKAGLTGYAQVYGKYNTTTYDKLKFDLIYVESANFLLDLQLILLTLRVVFQKEATEGV